jgi:hypothetical protein
MSVAQNTQVVELYHRGLDAYFITSRANEQSALDGLSGNFTRTGMHFSACAPNARGNVSRICRFYVSLPNLFTSSHFYGRDDTDCAALPARQIAGFADEGIEFSAAVPDNRTEIVFALIAEGSLKRMGTSMPSGITFDKHFSALKPISPEFRGRFNQHLERVLATRKRGLANRVPE